MKIKKAIIILSGIIIFLHGCANYQFSSASKSTAIETISKDTFRVNFCAAISMSKEEIEKYAMQRASEITLSKGYSHFVVLNKRDDSQNCTLEVKKKYDQKAQQEFSYESPYMKPNITLTIQGFSRSTELPEGAVDAEQFLNENFPGLQQE